MLTVEKVVLNQYLENGWFGLDWEGSPIHILIDAASMKYRWEESGQSSFSIVRNYSEHFSITSQVERDKHIGFWEWKNSLGRSFFELIDPSVNVDEKTMMENIDYYLRLNYESLADHRIFSFLIDLWKSIGKERFRKMLEFMFEEETYAYSSGWPDLTLVKGSQHLFIEVKSLSDKFHASQIRTYKKFGKQLSLPWYVAIVRPQ